MVLEMSGASGFQGTLAWGGVDVFGSVVASWQECRSMKKMGSRDPSVSYTPPSKPEPGGFAILGDQALGLARWLLVGG